MTAEKLRKTLSTPGHSIGLRSITRGLTVLKAQRLVDIVGLKKSGHRKVYHVTEGGRQIATELAESPIIRAHEPTATSANRKV